MKTYNFTLVNKIIKKFDELGLLKEAYLGIEDQWLRTNSLIWKEGGHELWIPRNFKKLQEQFIEEYNKCRHQYEIELLLFNYAGICVKRVPGSEWSMPILELHLKSGTKYYFECGLGEYNLKDTMTGVNRFKYTLDGDRDGTQVQIDRMNIKVEKYSPTKTYKP